MAPTKTHSATVPTQRTASQPTGQRAAPDDGPYATACRTPGCTRRHATYTVRLDPEPERAARGRLTGKVDRLAAARVTVHNPDGMRQAYRDAVHLLSGLYGQLGAIGIEDRIALPPRIKVYGIEVGDLVEDDTMGLVEATR